MSDTPPPVFARDYIRTAQITSLGYMAARLKTLPLEVNTTGDKLAEYISKTPEGKNFTPAELAAFAKEYRFIGSTSPGTGAAGGDAVAFQNIETGSIFVGNSCDRCVIPEIALYYDGSGQHLLCASAPLRDINSIWCPVARLWLGV
jgi:hypothetical protein